MNKITLTITITDIPEDSLEPTYKIARELVKERYGIDIDKVKDMQLSFEDVFKYQSVFGLESLSRITANAFSLYYTVAAKKIQSNN